MSQSLFTLDSWMRLIAEEAQEAMGEEDFNEMSDEEVEELQRKSWWKRRESKRGAMGRKG